MIGFANVTIRLKAACCFSASWISSGATDSDSFWYAGSRGIVVVVVVVVVVMVVVVGS